MKRPTSRSSRASRSSSPALVFEIRPSRRVQLIACGIGLTLLFTLMLPSRVPVAAQLLTLFAVSGMAARPLLHVVWVRGSGAVTHVEWDADGKWRVGLKGQRPTDALLLNDSAILGPCVFLIWSQAGRRRYALIDRPTIDPLQYSQLRARLRLC